MKNIKDLRERVGLRQEDVARMMGVGRSAVAMWESGATVPGALKLPRLASILHCTIDQLYGREPPEEQAPGGENGA